MQTKGQSCSNAEQFPSHVASRYHPTMSKLPLVFVSLTVSAAGFTVAIRAQTAPATSSQPATTTSATTATTQATRPTTTTVPIRERPAPPQAARTGSVTGRILDATGKPVSGAIIIFSSRTPTSDVPRATTLPDGTFTLANFPAGPTRCTLTIMSGGQVVGTVDMTINATPGAVTRLDGDIRVNGAVAVPVKQ